MSEFIPQDLIFKILTWLPPKPLIKLKCVSKSWNSFISSPYFISWQTQRAATISKSTFPILIMHFYNESNEIYSVYIDNKDKFSLQNTTTIEFPFSGYAQYFYTIKGSCNGELCLKNDSSILLWNPIIKRKVVLPIPRRKSQNIDGSFLIFVLRFGFDVESNDYKVVKLAYAKYQNNRYVRFPPKVEVYSLSVRSWREIKNVEIPHHRNLEFSPTPVFVNRNLHWLAVRHEERRKNFIMTFDISHEVLDEIPLPEQLVYEFKSFLTLVVIQESLAVYQRGSDLCSFWILNKCGDVKSWGKKFNIRLAHVYRIHGSRKNDDILLTLKSGALISYNLETGASVDIGISDTKFAFYVGSFVESLALMNEGEKVHEPIDTESESDYYDEGW